MAITKKQVYIALAILLLLALLIYFYTYFFAKKNNKVIYEKDGKRIYLIERKPYGAKGREYWKMVLEDKTTGGRTFIMGNTKKGYPEKKMAAIIINTVNQGKKASFDQVESVGVTMRPAKTDIHSNLVEKKGKDEILDGFSGMEFEFPDLKAA